MSEGVCYEDPRSRFGLRPAALYATVAVAFLASRGLAFFALSYGTDPQLFREYADDARRDGLAGLYAGHTVEYPPLAAAFAAAVGAVADAVPGDPTPWFRYRLHPPPTAADARYQVTLALVLLAVDLGLAAGVLALARRAYPDESAAVRAARLGVYVAATGLLGPVLYDRLDLVVGAFAVLALLARRRPVVAYLVLVAGVTFKLIPLVLLPVWVLAAAGGSVRRAVREAAVAGACLAVGVGGAYLVAGDGAFRFLAYHGERGVQVEAAYAWPLVLAGAPVGHSHSSFTLTGPTADAVARAAPAFAAVVLGVALVVAARPLAVTEKILPALAAAATLVWLASVLANKVGSPQFLLWLAPLVALLPLRSRADAGWAAGFLALCWVVSLVYPTFYDDVIAATPLGVALLALRSALLTALTVLLSVRVWKLA